MQDAMNEKLLERLADAEHESWSRWMHYLFSKCQVNADGSVLIPEELVDRWEHQSITVYADLSETEKESDRKEVRLIMPIIADALREWFE